MCENNLTKEELMDMSLPCPFCGEKPKYVRDFMPPMIGFCCINDECNARPSVSISVRSKRNDGETETYSPLFEESYSELIEKWNGLGVYKKFRSLVDTDNQLIIESLNQYWNQAHSELQKPFLGDIERNNWIGIKNKCKVLLDKLM